MLTKLDAIDGECSDVGALQRALRVVLLNCRRTNLETYSVPYRAIHKAADTLGWQESEGPKRRRKRRRRVGMMSDWI
jgi:hypothetical protein